MDLTGPSGGNTAGAHRLARLRSAALFLTSASALIHWVPCVFFMAVVVFVAAPKPDRRTAVAGALAIAVVSLIVLVGSTPATAVPLLVVVGALLAVPVLLPGSLREGDWSTIGCGLALGVALNLAYAAVTLDGGDPLPIRGFTAHQNTLGALLAVSLPIIALSAVDSRRWVLSFATVLGLAGLLLTGSRSGLAAAVLALAVGLVARAHVGGKREGRSRNKVRPGTAVLAIGLTLVLVTAWALVRRPSLEQAFGLTGRAEVWSVAVEMVVRNPFFGYGPRGWLHHVQEIEPSLSPQRFPHPHSGFLAIAIDIGLLGLCYYCAYLLYLAARLTGGTRSDPRHTAVALGVMAAFVAVNVADAFVYDARFLALVALAWSAAMTRVRST